MLKNPIKERIKNGKPVFGVLTNLACAQLTEIFGIAGFDFIMFDMEHSTMSEETVEGLTRAAKTKGAIPMARVRQNSARSIMGVLDAGCLGVMVPQVETKEEAEEAVLSTRYRPHGKRGINWKVVASDWGKGDPAEYIRAANESILTMIQIETIRGAENITEIVTVEGIDVIIIGPADLSGSMGYPGNPGQEDVKKAIRRVMEVSKQAGIAVGVGGSTERSKMIKAQNDGALLFVLNPAEFIFRNCRELASGIKDCLIAE
jgi:2-keto-3-deoxy-L-rhamnonate aldolase RhmA